MVARRLNSMVGEYWVTDCSEKELTFYDLGAVLSLVFCDVVAQCTVSLCRNMAAFFARRFGFADEFVLDVNRSVASRPIFVDTFVVVVLMLILPSQGDLACAVFA
jgi:hypothetical protein